MYRVSALSSTGNDQQLLPQPHLPSLSFQLVFCKLTGAPVDTQSIMHAPVLGTLFFHSLPQFLLPMILHSRRFCEHPKQAPLRS